MSENILSDPLWVWFFVIASGVIYVLWQMERNP
jgi:hypothetical protein